MSEHKANPDRLEHLAGVMPCGRCGRVQPKVDLRFTVLGVSDCCGSCYAANTFDLRSAKVSVCHQVGCPGKGKHPPHGIGTGEWKAYEDKPGLPRSCCVSYPGYEHTSMCLFGQDSTEAVQTSVLQEAEQIINGDRRIEYGGASESFQRIANLWTTVLGHTVTSQEVALCLIQLKVARAMQDTQGDRPVKRDTIVDIAGYAGCLEKIGRGE